MIDAKTSKRTGYIPSLHLLCVFAPLRLCVVFLVVSLVTACVPAATPDVLNNTPGAPVTVTDDQVITTAFTLRYPSGWRVITSEAGAPSTVTLVAPGDCEIMVVSSVEVEPPSVSPDCGSTSPPETRIIELRDRAITIVGIARESDSVAFLDIFERTITSVEDPSLLATPDAIDTAPR